MLFNGVDDVPWQLTLVYSPPTYHMRRDFWDSLDGIGRAFSGPWLVIGDFNFVLTSADKRGGQAAVGSSSGGLRRVVD